eukprot:352421-Chlamydomonas_euryale.AAC.32
MVKVDGAWRFGVGKVEGAWRFCVCKTHVTHSGSRGGGRGQKALLARTDLVSGGGGAGVALLGADGCMSREHVIKNQVENSGTASAVMISRHAQPHGQVALRAEGLGLLYIIHCRWRWCRPPQSPLPHGTARPHPMSASASASRSIMLLVFLKLMSMKRSASRFSDMPDSSSSYSPNACTIPHSSSTRLGAPVREQPALTRLACAMRGSDVMQCGASTKNACTFGQHHAASSCVPITA